MMVRSQPTSTTITTLDNLEEKSNLIATHSDRFFPEWTEDLPELTELEQTTLEQIRHRFYRHRKRGSLPEGTVNQLLISPLLTLAGLFDEPFFVTTEPSVELVIEDRDEILRGRIDTLIVQQQLWVLVVESKNTSLSASLVLPQALAYMMSNPHPERPVYGLVTNGDHSQLIKILICSQPQYDLSNVFSSLLPRRNQLQDVLRILKKIGQII